ncbi:copper amine oxidase N-terminal domain-containing protein [Cohnella sp.]|uniref:copper amine oxidase N-terminal domain-containing protein n=1 Tax=Cohnella sp. TaxID=1883426 RepID=UPI0035687A18
MKKVLFALIATMIGMVSISSMSYAAAPIEIFINDKRISTDTAPIWEKGSILVPVRAVVEALDASVVWDPEKNTVTIRKWSEVIVLTVGKKTASFQGRPRWYSEYCCEIDLSTPVKRIKNRVYIPIRFLSQHLGYQVDWKNNMVIIRSPLSANDRTTLYEGDLQAARELMIKMSYSSMHTAQSPLEVIGNHEGFFMTYLFPEGEALRFYLIRKDIISYVELKDDFLVASWQAYSKDGDGIKSILEGKFGEQRGTAPIFEKVFLYYSTGGWGDSDSQSSGRVDLEGNLTITGHKHWAGGFLTTDEGIVSLKLPEEIRSELP